MRACPFRKTHLVVVFAISSGCIGHPPSLSPADRATVAKSKRSASEETEHIVSLENRRAEVALQLEEITQRRAADRSNYRVFVTEHQTYQQMLSFGPERETECKKGVHPNIQPIVEAHTYLRAYESTSERDRSLAALEYCRNKKLRLVRDELSSSVQKVRDAFTSVVEANIAKQYDGESIHVLARRDGNKVIVRVQGQIPGTALSSQTQANEQCEIENSGITELMLRNRFGTVRCAPRNPDLIKNKLASQGWYSPFDLGSGHKLTPEKPSPPVVDAKEEEYLLDLTIKTSSLEKALDEAHKSADGFQAKATSLESLEQDAQQQWLHGSKRNAFWRKTSGLIAAPLGLVYGVGMYTYRTRKIERETIVFQKTFATANTQHQQALASGDTTQIEAAQSELNTAAAELARYEDVATRQTLIHVGIGAAFIVAGTAMWIHGRKLKTSLEHRLDKPGSGGRQAKNNHDSTLTLTSSGLNLSF